EPPTGNVLGCLKLLAEVNDGHPVAALVLFTGCVTLDNRAAPQVFADAFAQGSAPPAMNDPHKGQRGSHRGIDIAIELRFDFGVAKSSNVDFVGDCTARRLDPDGS